MSYMVDKPPSEDKLLQRGVRVWEGGMHRPLLTMTRSAYKPYSTYVFAHRVVVTSTGLTSFRTKNKVQPWKPVALSR